MKLSKKNLVTAVSAALALGTAGQAAAVHVNPDQLAQALVQAYYTVNADQSTLINITNTSPEAVAVKVRLHEALNSRDTLDFIVVLSPEDVWNATITKNGSGVPILKTGDKSCTVPAIPTAGIALRSLAYTRAFDDGGNGTFDADGNYTASPPADPTMVLNRMREGYATFIMMGSQTQYESGAYGVLAEAARHNPATGVPNNCPLIVRAFTATNAAGTTSVLGTDDSALELVRLSFPNYQVNPLKGSYNIVNAAKGFVTAGGGMLPLADFWEPEPGDTGALVTLQLPMESVNEPNWQTRFFGSWVEPTLASANTYGQYLDDDGDVVEGKAEGAIAIADVLQSKTVWNQWTRIPLGDPAASIWETSTDVVISQPVKRYFTDMDGLYDYDPGLTTWIGLCSTSYGIADGASRPEGWKFAALVNPYSGRAYWRGAAGDMITDPNDRGPYAQYVVRSTAVANGTVPALPTYSCTVTTQRNGYACDPANYTIWDREENYSTGADYSPGEYGDGLCHEVSVLSFSQGEDVDTSLTLGSNFPYLIDIRALENTEGFLNGVVELDLAANSNNQLGLPTTGMAVTNRIVPLGGDVSANDSVAIPNAQEKGARPYSVEPGPTP